MYTKLLTHLIFKCIDVLMCFFIFRLSGSQFNCTHNISEDGIVGGDICGIGLQPDSVNLTCSINFRGNKAPELLWSRDNGDNVTRYITIRTVSNSIATSTVLISTNERMNGSSFICSMSMNERKYASVTTPHLENIEWSSPVLKILCKYTRNLFIVYVQRITFVFIFLL